jgi:primosomal protein N'
VYAAVFPLLTARALTEPFDYLVPEELAARLQTGSLVAVPLGRQTVLGVVVGLSALTTHAGRILPLRAVIDLPPIPAELLELGRIFSVNSRRKASASGLLRSLLT